MASCTWMTTFTITAVGRPRFNLRRAARVRRSRSDLPMDFAQAERRSRRAPSPPPAGVARGRRLSLPGRRLWERPGHRLRQSRRARLASLPGSRFAVAGRYVDHDGDAPQKFDYNCLGDDLQRATRSQTLAGTCLRRWLLSCRCSTTALRRENSPRRWLQNLIAVCLEQSPSLCVGTDSNSSTLMFWCNTDSSGPR